MSPVASTARLSAAVTSRTIRRKLVSRGFVSSSPRNAATNYLMPAMSPTMSEGNITSWKVKEGDSFSAGDVLLEIETDKAQMDVEAQEEGVLAKIMQGDGAKGIQVGARIAVMAEEGDDLSSLEIPADEQSAGQQSDSESQPSEKTAEKTAEEPKQQSSQDSRESRPSTKPASGKPQEQRYPLYPSVAHLLHTNNIPLSDASKIPATGPAGRLLKGDVLAYLNAIPPSYSADLSARLEKLSSLDLSNIKRITPTKPSPQPVQEQPAEPKEEVPTQIAVPVSLAAVFETQSRIRSSLGLDLPLSTFIARASQIANDDLPRARAPPSADELFDAVLGLDAAPRTSRGAYVPQVTALGPAASSVPAGPLRKSDPFDELLGIVPERASPRRYQGAAGVGGARNVFSVAAHKGEEARVRTYLERVKSVLEAEPGRCVL